MQTVFSSSFEEGFYDYQGIGELTCPYGWTPSWVQGPGGGKLHRPEYDAKDRDKSQPEVRTGRYAANFFTVYATHDGCLYRKFRVGAGKLVRASVWCMNVTNSKDGPDGGHGMRLGIDPAGGTNHLGMNVVYGDYWSSYMKGSEGGWKERKWKQVDVETISQADEITVFLHAKCDYPADINASHWDDFVLDVGEVPPDYEPPDLSIAGAQKIGDMNLAQLEELIRRIAREEANK
jgi:hypothetical protein